MNPFLLFKKRKKEELPEGNLTAQPPLPNSYTPHEETRNPFQEQSVEIQLILNKLELINARLQNIEQRIATIEKIAKESQEPPRW